MLQGLGILQGILILAILIFVHELGHFLLAKLCGVNVLEFAIGFGKKILFWKKGITRYSIGLIPLGGYVRMMGDDPRLLDPEYQNRSVEEVKDELKTKTGDFIGLEEIEQRTPEEIEILNDRSKWFLAKNYWQKSAIVFAGPLFNLLFAWIAAIFLVIAYGAQELVEEPIIGSIRKESPAEIAGLKLGDRVIRAQDQEIASWMQFSKIIRKSKGSEIKILVVNKDQIQREINLKPERINQELAAVYGDNPKDYVIGVGPSVKNKDASFLESIKIGTQHTIGICNLTVKSMLAMFKGLISPKHIGGPISIVNIAAKSAEGGLESMINFMIMISISLAILNLLPIPVLDGGHLLFFLIEAIIGSRLSLKFYEKAGMVGMAAILSLMIFAVGNDLFNLFF